MLASEDVCSSAVNTRMLSGAPNAMEVDIEMRSGVAIH